MGRRKRNCEDTQMNCSAPREDPGSKHMPSRASTATSGHQSPPADLLSAHNHRLPIWKQSQFHVILSLFNKGKFK